MHRTFRRAFTGGVLAVAVAAAVAGLAGLSGSVPTTTAGSTAEHHFQYSKNVVDASNGALVASDTKEVATTLVGLIQAAKRGSNVYLAVSGLNDDPDTDSDQVDQVLDALVDSGVDLHVVTGDKHAGTGQHPSGGSSACPAGGKHAKGVGDWTGAAVEAWCIATEKGAVPADFVSCKAGCHSSNNFHNKFWIFGNSGGQRVVVQESANLGSVELRNQTEDLLVFRGDDTIFGDYREYFDDLARDRTAADYGARHGLHSGPIQVWRFPFDSASSDPYLDDLDQLRCSKGARVYLAANIVSQSYDRLNTRLRQLQGAGCDVRIIITVRSNPDGGSSSQTYAAFSKGANQPKVRCIAHLHAKMMVVSGSKASGGAVKYVWDGSRPFYGVGTADDTGIRLASDSATDAYFASFDRLWSVATTAACASAADDDGTTVEN